MDLPDNSALEWFLKWVWVPVTVGLGWLAKRTVKHGEDIQVLKATTASTDRIHDMLKEATEPLERELRRAEEKSEVRASRIYDKIEELRKAIAKSRDTD